MRTLWTILSAIFTWLSVVSLTVALQAAKRTPPANLATPELRSEYVQVAWTGFAAILVFTIIFIFLAVRAYRRAAKKPRIR